jgi:hypothetical protein
VVVSHSSTFQNMFNEDDDYSSVMKNPYRDDPDWYKTAYGVQGGAEDISSSESEEEGQPVVLPTTCVCGQCRSVQILLLQIRNTLVRIWIRGSVPLTNSSGFGSRSGHFRH